MALAIGGFEAPRQRTFAIFVKHSIINGQGRRVDKYIRRPYNIVEITRTEGVTTYVQPAGQRRLSAGGIPAISSSNDAVSAFEQKSLQFLEAYDDVRFYDTPPSFNSVYGQDQNWAPSTR
jgi:hypothetical protein